VTAAADTPIRFSMRLHKDAPLGIRHSTFVISGPRRSAAC